MRGIGSRLPRVANGEEMGGDGEMELRNGGQELASSEGVGLAKGVLLPRKRRAYARIASTTSLDYASKAGWPVADLTA